MTEPDTVAPIECPLSEILLSLFGFSPMPVPGRDCPSEHAEALAPFIRYSAHWRKVLILLRECARRLILPLRGFVEYRETGATPTPILRKRPKGGENGQI